VSLIPQRIYEKLRSFGAMVGKEKIAYGKDQRLRRVCACEVGDQEKEVIACGRLRYPTKVSLLYGDLRNVNCVSCESSPAVSCDSTKVTLCVVCVVSVMWNGSFERR